MIRLLRQSVLLCLLFSSSVLAEQPRIVTLSPGITELVFAAGAGDLLVGTVAYSDYPSEAQAVPRIGDAFRVDFEALRRMNPTLVLSWDSGTPRAISDRLQQLDFNVVAIDALSLGDIANEIERIGELAGTSAVAEKSAHRVRNEFAQLREQYADRERLTVFYQISANPWFTVNGDHVISEVLSLCGGDNVFADVEGLAPAITAEAILRADPAVVIAGSDDDAWTSDWQRWPFLGVVQRQTLYRVDPSLVSRATPRLVQGASRICAVLDDARSRLQ